MGRTVVVVTVLAQVAVCAAIAQEPKPTFDAASIRRATPGETGGRVQFLPGGRFRAHNVSLDFVIQQVYGVRDFQIVAAPEWRAIIGDGVGKRYYIEATGDETATEQRVKEMVKALLAERFALRLHKETREMPVYNLIPAKGGPKGVRSPDGPPGGIALMASGWMRGQRVSISHFVDILSRYVDRPIIDRTNISGVLEFNLTWTPQDLSLSGNAREAGYVGGECPGDYQQMADRFKLDVRGITCPNIFAAVEEQLGLRLEPIRGSVDVLVIDSVQQPTEN